MGIGAAGGVETVRAAAGGGGSGGSIGGGVSHKTVSTSNNVFAFHSSHHGRGRQQA